MESPGAVGAARGTAEPARRLDVPKRTCSVDGCERYVMARDWCSTHYTRWRRHGAVDAFAPPAPPVPLADRFWPKVDRWDPDHCWEWIACKNGAGYGKVRARGRSDLAHRLAYEMLVGPIPPGLQLDHLCRNRGCVNPKHLEPVTRKENILRGVGASAINVVKTHCPAGHPYNTGNTYRNKRGHRFCRACHRDAERDRRRLREVKR